MRKTTVLCFLSALLVLFAGVGMVFAAQKYVSESIEVIHMASVSAQITEEYERAVNVYPGSTIDKVVNVKNTGTSDIVIRVRVEKAWGKSRDQDGKLIVDDSYAADNIMLTYNTEYWYYDEADGYFYYKAVLNPEKTTLAPLFKEFYIDKSTNNSYQGLEADILVKMECIQAVADGITLWGKTYQEVGITYIPPQNSNVTTATAVTFTGGDEDFVFHPESTDLFANFKNLLPGETRSQTIEVKSTFQSKEGVEIFLRAEMTEQSLATPETRALVNALLYEYATIIITDESGQIIYSGPIWGAPDSHAAAPDSMGNDISLGIFAAGEGKKLNVQLQLDPTMGNEYMELWGLIKWVWSAEIPDAQMITVSGTKTWNHGSNPENLQPKEITIYLKKNGSILETKTITEKDEWCWSFEVPRYDAEGNEIHYTIDEEAVEGYTTTKSGYDLKNTYKSEKVIVAGAKTWDHGTNTSNRPESIMVYVKNGDETVAAQRVTANEDWKWSFELPKYEEGGKEIVYTVTEGTVENYTLVKSDGYNLTNKFVSVSYPGDTPKSAATPKTGDAVRLWWWSGLMIVSVAVFVSLLIMNQRSGHHRGMSGYDEKEKE